MATTLIDEELGRLQTSADTGSGAAVTQVVEHESSIADTSSSVYSVPTPPDPARKGDRVPLREFRT
jgi:hypothetical protein